MKSSGMRLVRSDGREFLVGKGSDWVLAEDGLDDWLNPSYTVTTSPNVLRDGSSLISKRVDEEDRTAKLIYAGWEPEGARLDALDFFNPKHTFKCYLYHINHTRWCEGELSAFACPVVYQDQMLTITFTLLCPNPYWHNADIARPFGATTPMRGFPYVSHMADSRTMDMPRGFLCSITVFDGKNSIYNNGDVPCNYRLEVDVLTHLENPRLEKDGKHIEIAATFDAGDRLLIDFEASPPRVECNGVSIVQKCTRDSDFLGMVMPLGKNVFKFTDAQGDVTNRATVTLNYSMNYLGV